MILAALLAAPALTLDTGEGPISKFDKRPPVVEQASARAMGDIERCLIDLPGIPAPNVYRQLDKPDQVTIVWVSTGQFNGTAMARADLRTVSGGGTNVRLWLKDASARACLG